MKSLYKTTILALAAICLLASPAISHPWDRDTVGIHNGEWQLLADDITAEELDNMTLAEIKALKQQEMQRILNMTLSEIRDLREQRMQEMDNMTLAELEEKKQDGMLRGQNRGCHKVAGNFGGFGPVAGTQVGCGREACQMGSPERLHGGMWMLLVDDATRDDLENMTLAEIDELRLQKMQELENMTLSEVQNLKERKMQELGNMTLSEIKEQRPQMNGRGGPFMGFQLQEGNDFQDGQSWMPGTGPR
jgi:hypothetical protein